MQGEIRRHTTAFKGRSSHVDNHNEVKLHFIRKSLQVLFCPLILLYITAGFITPFTAGSCTSGNCFATFRFVIGKDMVDGHALLGHVFANVSVIGVKGCYRACQTNCRCISFNFMTHSNQKNCQLNEENRHIKPSALRAVASSQYYDLVVRYNIAVGNYT